MELGFKVKGILEPWHGFPDPQESPNFRLGYHDGIQGWMPGVFQPSETI